MNRHLSCGSALLAVVGLLAIAATTVAQAPRPPRVNDRAPTAPNGPRAVQPPARAPQLQGDQRGMTNATDRMLATCLLIDNENEVALAKIGVDRAKNDDVRNFAKQMQDDHQKFIARLSAFTAATTQPGSQPVNAPQGNVRDDGRARPDGAVQQSPPQQQPQQSRQPANAGNVREGERRTAARPDIDNPALQAGPALNPISLKQELAQQCRQSVQRELEQKDGDEFDRCYMHMQLGAHMMALDTMEVFQRHATGELKQALTDGIETVRGHLAHAKEIAKQLDKEAIASNK